MISRKLAAACVASCLALAFAGCSASGNVSGGDLRFDAGPEQPVDLDGAAYCGYPEAGAAKGHTWPDLYRDYFGPTGAASCAGNGTCHGDANQPGAQASNYVCGPDSDGCYDGITSPRAGLLMKGDTTSDPKSTSLYAILRKKCGTGSMPKSPPFAFDAGDIQRIVDWLRAGAPKN